MDTPSLYREELDEPRMDENCEFFLYNRPTNLFPAKAPSFSLYPLLEMENVEVDQNPALDKTILDFYPEEEMSSFDASFNFQRNDKVHVNYDIKDKEDPPEPMIDASLDSPASKEIGPYTFPKESKNFYSLAVRNLKSNFGTGLIQFLEFRKDLAEFQKNQNEAAILRKLLNFLRGRAQSFVSFAGWKDVFKDHEHGKTLRKKAKEFFGKSFARTYVQFGKIREEYKPVYYRKIKCFYEGCKNPELLNPASFNKY